jgi:hypothetical protein
MRLQVGALDVANVASAERRQLFMGPRQESEFELRLIFLERTEPAIVSSPIVQEQIGDFLKALAFEGARAPRV